MAISTTESTILPNGPTTPPEKVWYALALATFPDTDISNIEKQLELRLKLGRHHGVWVGLSA